MLIHIRLEDVFVMLCDPSPPSWFWIFLNINIGTIIFLGLLCWLFSQTMSQYYETTSIDFNFSITSHVFLEHFQILSRNGIPTILVTVFTCKCACEDEHMMVTYISLDATIWHWLHYLICNITYISFLSPFIFQMLITMVFLAIYLLPMGFFLLPLVGFLLYVLLIHLGLHFI